MSGAQFQFERFTAFGWIAHRKVLAAGDEFSVRYNGDADVSAVNNVTMYTKGRIDVDFGGVNPNSYPGILTAGALPQKDYAPGDRVFPAGTVLRHVAATDAEFWCFNYEINRRQLPVVEKVVLAPGETVAVAARKLMLMRGTLRMNGAEYTGPVALDIRSADTATAATDCYGVFVSAERGSETPA